MFVIHIVGEIKKQLLTRDELDYYLLKQNLGFFAHMAGAAACALQYDISSAGAQTRNNWLTRLVGYITNWRWTGDFFQILCLFTMQWVDTKIIPIYSHEVSLSMCLRYFVGILAHLLITVISISIAGTMQNKGLVSIFKPLYFIREWSGTFLYISQLLNTLILNRLNGVTFGPYTSITGISITFGLLATSALGTWLLSFLFKPLLDLMYDKLKELDNYLYQLYEKAKEDY